MRGGARPDADGRRKFRAAVRQMVETRGVKYFPSHLVKEVDPAQKQIHFANGAVTRPSISDLCASSSRAPQAVRDANRKTADGSRQTATHSRPDSRASTPSAMSVPLKIGRPLPKAGVFAHGQAEWLPITLAVGGAPRTQVL